MQNMVSEATGRQVLAQHGFTEQFDEGENGDFGPRLYFCRAGDIPRNQYGRPTETAQLDCWGPDSFTVSIKGDML